MTPTAHCSLLTAHCSLLTAHCLLQALGAANGGAAASLAVAEKYVGAFGELAKSSTTVLLPANTGDVGAMVAQAMAVYGKMSPGLPTVPEEAELAEETHRSEVNINLD